MNMFAAAVVCLTLTASVHATVFYNDERIGLYDPTKFYIQHPIVARPSVLPTFLSYRAGQRHSDGIYGNSGVYNDGYYGNQRYNGYGNNAHGNDDRRVYYQKSNGENSIDDKVSEASSYGKYYRSELDFYKSNPNYVPDRKQYPKGTEVIDRKGNTAYGRKDPNRDNGYLGYNDIGYRRDGM